uniref:WYL domain-containing protein n=1 Tax=Salinivibrio sp. PR932 TaxID=1909492 RepID=UPI001F52AABB|nr:WYL domain-containing protein [Salinivibrio sp. PR932]
MDERLTLQDSTGLEELSQAQRERLAHIDFTLFFKGEAGRSYLTERFSVAPSVATQDFARYKELVPSNVMYDEKRRVHLKTSAFQPLFNYDVMRTLATISQGFGDGFLGKVKPPMACEAPFHLNKPKLEIVASVSEAIHKRAAINIEYTSLSTGKGRRQIVPHTLVDNGLRWHVRAFDRSHKKFRDFVLTRINEVQLIEDKVNEESETLQWDKQWNRIVELDLMPHPALTHPEAVSMDYGMENNCLRVEIRAAFAGYLLRLWNVDCSKSDQDAGRGHHLALKNPEALYGVDNAALAPGYSD